MSTWATQFAIEAFTPAEVWLEKSKVICEFPSGALSVPTAAIFSDWTWHANEQLDLTFGFRYTHDDVFAKFTGFGLFRTPRVADPADPTGATPLSWDGSEEFDDFAPRFVIGWQWAF